MFAVIFEVQPKKEQWQAYLDLAGMLRPELVQIEGFIDNERFKSMLTEGRVLSLSTWADEKAVIRWRTHAGHHGVQEKGRFKIFEDYHLRVGEITADTHVPSGHRLQEQRFDATEVGSAAVVTISEIDPAEHRGETVKSGQASLNELAAQLHVPSVGDAGVVTMEYFSSITTQGKSLLLVSWRDAAAVARWQPPAALPRAGRLRHRTVRVIRDYGMGDRREAPQYYPPVERPGIA